MSKNIVFNSEARLSLKNGVDKLANAVTSTLGPSGRNVIIEQQQGNPISTKDGVTVAKSIELEDAQENIGAQIVKQASIKTADEAGDEDAPVGEATGETLDNEADLNFCFIRDSDTNQYIKNGEQKVKKEECDVVPQSCWASSASDCTSKSGFSNKDIPSSKPQRVDGKNDIEDDDSEGARIDYSKTLEAAYDNLQEVLGKEGIKGLTGETTRLINEQKNLMDSMKSIADIHTDVDENNA